MTDWDQRFLDLAAHVATWSKDPSTQVGCVIVRPDKTVASLGYNGFPRGVQDNSFRLTDRTIKLAYTVHSEPNAIAAAREPLHGYTCYTYPFPPCSNCAGLLVQSGIARVVAPWPTAAQLERWGPSFGHMETIFSESGVELDVLSYARPEDR